MWLIDRTCEGKALMKISATVKSTASGQETTVSSAGFSRSLELPAKTTGRGCSVNGGELLALALATCFCNDLYREAGRLGIIINGCEVTAKARFDGVGLPAETITYAARVDSPAAPADIEHLLRETDRVAEIHNTLRTGCPVRREVWHEQGTIAEKLGSESP